MTLGLRPGISFCEVGGRYLFLDLRTDRYFSLDNRAESAFRGLVDASQCQDGHILRRLCDNGLLIERAERRPLPCPPMPTPETSLLDAPPLPATMMERISAMNAILRTGLRLKHRGLGPVIDQVRQRKARMSPISAPPDRLNRLAAAFESSARLLRSHDQCLVRSIALADCLASRAIAADLVIAVRIRPFAAHSWVQVGSQLMNDRRDQVTSYTPILVL